MEESSAQIHGKKPVCITITLPTDAYFLSGIRDFSLFLAKNLGGFNDQWAYRAQAVIDELCNNAIEHGSKPGATITITIEAVKGEYIEFIVEDHGDGNKVTANDMNKLMTERKHDTYLQHIGVRGRGLVQIVLGWTDELEFFDVQPSGLRVRARKYLKNAVSQEPVANRISLKNFALSSIS